MAYEASLSPREGLARVLEAILDSDLPGDTILKRRALGQAADMLGHARSPGALQGGIFNMAPTPEQLKSWDPELVNQYLNDVARAGRDAWLPQTVKGLSAIEPTLDLQTLAHQQPVHGWQMDNWALGVNADVSHQGVGNLAHQLQRGGGMVGQTFLDDATGSIFADPIQHFATHETGHAAARRLQEFVGQSSDQIVRRHWNEYLDRLIADSADPERMLSRYATKGQAAAANRWLERYKTTPRLERSENLRPLEQLNRQLIMGEKIDPKHLRDMPSILKSEIAQEPLAEAFAAHATPRKALQFWEQPAAATERAMARGDELMDVIDLARGAGFRGAIAPELLFKGAAGIGGGLAFDYFAPRFIDRLVAKKNPTNQLLKNMATGGSIGAGVGSIIPGVGTLVGAGVGAGAGALLGQVF